MRNEQGKNDAKIVDAIKVACEQVGAKCVVAIFMMPRSDVEQSRIVALSYGADVDLRGALVREAQLVLEDMRYDYDYERIGEL